MHEVVVRFEDSGPDDGVRGSVRLAGQDRGAPYRFHGWLQLLGLLEELSIMTEESPDPPRPLPSPRPGGRP
jgi:hypothetical protein